MQALSWSHPDARAGSAIDGLKGRKWLVGNRLSYADVRVATLMPFARAALLPVDDVPQVLRHAAQPDELPFWRAPFAGLQAADQGPRLPPKRASSIRVKRGFHAHSHHQ